MSLYGKGFYNVSADILPSQMVPLKEKLAKGTDDQRSWGEQCMDSLETIGKNQYRSNLRLIENYEMIRGRFIYSHYFETEGAGSMISQLTAEFELPNYLRHYDIISPVVNTLCGEWQKRPDLFRVQQLGDGAANEYLRAKMDLTQRYVLDKINTEINKRLIERGIDPNKNDFENQEQASQYQQTVQQARKALTPIEIQKYMDTDFLTQAEIWSQHQIEYNKETYNLPEKEKVEFEDMCTADRAFRHFYITPTGRNEETWNTINTFYHKTPDTVYIEEGDYVGRIFHLSLSTIIDRYGYLMTKSDFNLINRKKDEDTDKNKKWSDSKYNWVYDQYLVPFIEYPGYDMMRNHWNKRSAAINGDIPFLDESFNKNLNNDSFYRDREGFYFVTEAYWKTQKKIIKVTYIDEELGTKVVTLVDENYVIPDYFVESTQPFDNDQDINTYVETYVNEVWRGIKINTGTDKNLRKDLYLGIGPNDFQFKGDRNMYGCKLPVVGQIFSVRNSGSMSLVDMMKPHQIGFNVAMNQLYQLAEKEIGMFVMLDVNMFPNSKDWGGEDSWDKWMLLAKTLGMLPADTSPENLKSSLGATGGFLPKVLDLNLAAQMVSRQNMAMFYKQQAMEQVGFNQYRLGQFAQTSTATGIQEGQEASYTQTESYFTNFSNYVRRCHQAGLEMDQFLQSQQKDIAFTYIRSDLNRAFVKMLGTDLLLAEIGVRVSNSQEHARQLQMMRQYALENNTAGMTPPDALDVISMNSPAEIRRQMKVSYDKLLAQQQQAQQLEEQKIAQEHELRATELQQQETDKQLDRQNKLDVAKINAGVAILNSSDKQKAETDANEKQGRLALDRAKTIADMEYNVKKLAVEQQRIAADLQIQNQETQSVRVLKGQELAQKKKESKDKKKAK
jgi:hypothetical protein